MILDNNVRFIIETLNKKGYEAFIVGGCVRDIILKREPKDFDITTSATPEEIKNSFEKTFDTGILHGTVTVVLDKVNFEVTTYRIDGEYNDNRHPESVIFTKSLKEDLLRRDFTMNAIAYHYDIGFVDYFKGKEDIKNKIIRGVGEPNKRFQEDGLRMMRAIRFAAQLDFKIEDETYKAILNNKSLIKNISIERIRDELIKIILSEHFEKISFLIETGLISIIQSNFCDYLISNKEKIISLIKISKEDLIIRLSLLFYNYKNENELDFILKFFKFDNKTIKLVKTLVMNLNLELDTDKYFLRKQISKLGINTFIILLDIKKYFIDIENENNKIIYDVIKLIDEIILENDALNISDLKINGEDLIRLGVNKGKMIGDILENLLEQVLKEPSKNNKDILELEVKNIIQN